MMKRQATMTHWKKYLPVLLFAAIGVAVVGLHAEDVADNSHYCTGVGYQADACECPGTKDSDACACGACSADEQCQCIVAARQVSGSVTGTVDVFRTKVKTAGAKSFKDVVIFLQPVDGPSNYPAPSKPEQMDQEGLVFIPHVLAIQRGTTVDFLNNDNDKHNVYFLFDNSGIKEDVGTWAPGESRGYEFTESDTAITLCKLHLEMAAYVVVLDTPFFTTAVMDGKTQEASFTIRNVPPGKYTLNTWHKKLKLKGGEQEITVETGKVTDVALTITKAKYAKVK